MTAKKRNNTRVKQVRKSVIKDGNGKEIERIKATPEKDVEGVVCAAVEKVSDDEELLDDGTEIEYHCPVCSRIFDKVCNGNLALNTRFFY